MGSEKAMGNGPYSDVPAPGGGAGGAYAHKRLVLQRGEEVTASDVLYRVNRVKLKLISNGSALLSGFAVVALVELNIEDDAPKALVAAYGITTSIVIAIHLFAMLVAFCTLPTLELIARVVTDDAHRSKAYQSFQVFIDVAWYCSTGLGIMLFLADFAIIAWVKFLHFKAAAWGASMVAAPLVVLFAAFAVVFRNREGKQLEEITEMLYRQAEEAHVLQRSRRQTLERNSVTSAGGDGATRPGGSGVRAEGAGAGTTRPGGSGVRGEGAGGSGGRAAAGGGGRGGGGGKEWQATSNPYYGGADESV